MLGAFFVVMFAANVALIYFALHTLHGEELENPYDASQAYNRRIAAARAQDERGWNADVDDPAEGEGERVVAEFRDRDGAPIAGLRGDGALRASVRRGRRTARRRCASDGSTTKASQPRARRAAGRW